MQGKVIQTLGAPIQTVSELEKFAETESLLGKWDHCSIVSDKDNVIILLRDKTKKVSQALRICFETKEDILYGLSILKLKPRSKLIPCSTIEAGIGDIGDIDNLNEINDRAEYFEKTEASAFYYFDVKSGEGENNRGKNISKPVAQQVVYDANGYCMYEGCGDYLLQDQLTGVNGNFHYLAHIVASSPNGPRGNELSHQLSDDPKNILLLCDTHHRLIDKVAVSEHPKVLLDEMRVLHVKKVGKLLEGLKYKKASTITAIWTVGSWVPELPSSVDIARFLAPLNAYHDGNSYQLARQAYANGVASHEWQDRVITELNAIKQHYSLTQDSMINPQAICAIGPSSILISLGAIIGNKNSLHAIPRSREKNKWCWVREEPLNEPFKVEGINEVQANSEEVVVVLSLTDLPAEFSRAIELLDSSGSSTIYVKAREPGNDCLGHPEEGHFLRELIHKLLHSLKNEYNTSKVHMLCCAPNAALIEAGRAIEHFHPSITLYDYQGGSASKSLIPTIVLSPDGNEVAIKAAKNAQLVEFQSGLSSITSTGNGDE